MLDRIIIQEKKKGNYLILILISFSLTILLSFINMFLGGNSLFLVALISLAFAYPLTSSARKLEREEIDRIAKSKKIFSKYKKELLLFWSLFIGITLGLYISYPFITDYTYQQKFFESISGYITNSNLTFLKILIKNLEVAFFTFIISFFIYSAIIFVIAWNASILAYFLTSFGSAKEAFITAIFLLSHGLLEIGGYIFAGIAGALFALRLDVAYSSQYYKSYEEGKPKIKKDRRHTFEKLINKQLIIDIIYLLSLAVIFITTAAIIEVL